MILPFNEYHSSFRVGAKIRDDATNKLYRVVEVDYDLKCLTLQSVEDEEDRGAKWYAADGAVYKKEEHPELFQSLIQIKNAIPSNDR